MILLIMKIRSWQARCFPVLFLVCGFAFDALGQQGDWNREGDLEDVEIEIVKEREVSLPPAARSFEKIPPAPAETTRPSFSYDFRPFSFDAPQVSPALLDQLWLHRMQAGIKACSTASRRSPRRISRTT